MEQVQMNNTLAPTKLGKVERYANVAVLIILGAQVALTTVSVISLYAMGFQHADTLPYVNVDGDMGISVLPLWLEYWFVFFLLYINFIPISLYVTMELTNIGQAYMMSNDLKVCTSGPYSPSLLTRTLILPFPLILSTTTFHIPLPLLLPLPLPADV
jgi:magnesium-transporting ATPase (P-type)